MNLNDFTFASVLIQIQTTNEELRTLEVVTRQYSQDGGIGTSLIWSLYKFMDEIYIHMEI